MLACALFVPKKLKTVLRVTIFSLIIAYKNGYKQHQKIILLKI